MTDFHHDLPFEIKFVSETGVFEGYASVFGVTDSVNDRIAPGAFDKSLARHRTEGRLPPLLWQHDMKEPIGAWREMFEDSHGLFVRGELFVTDIDRARSAYKLMRENVVTGLSIGYRAVQSHRDQKSGVRVLTEIELLEVSMVTAPANEQARVMRVKSILSGGGVPSEREFEAFLRDAGLSHRQAKGMIAHGYKSLSHHAPRDADDTEYLRALAQTIRALT
jgi:HK97 family phage prohead protease